MQNHITREVVTMAIKSSKQTSGEKVINTELNKTPFAIVESYKNLRTNLISISRYDNVEHCEINALFCYDTYCRYWYAKRRTH